MPSSGGQTCALDRKSTRLNSSHGSNSYAVFCLKKKPENLTFLFFSPPLSIRFPRNSPPLLSEFFTSGGNTPGIVLAFFNDPATTEIYTLSLHDALPILEPQRQLDERLHGPGLAVLLADPLIG